jgi:hypothetical protein
VKIDNVNNPGAVQSGSYKFENVTSDRKIEVSYKLKTYTITATAGDNGLIEPAGVINVEHGDEQGFNIRSESGYQIKEVIVDGIALPNKPSYFEFTNVTANHTIEAKFEQRAPGINTGEMSNVYIYPNPSKGLVNITVPKKSNVTIYDVAGRLIGSYKVIDKATIELNQPAGVYLIKVETGAEISTHRLVIVK